ncbi:MAG: hypothetical protein V6Z82_04125 [Flavobacteriales bacterium]
MMSGIDSQLQQALRDFSFTEGEIFPAVVRSVNKADKSLSIVDAQDLEYPDVRLTATLSDKDKIAVYPRADSSVLVAKIGGSDNTLVCIAYSEVEAVEGQIEDTSFSIDREGIHVERKGKSLYDTLKKLFETVQSLCDETAKIVVSVGTTVDIPAVNRIKQRIEDAVTKDLNEILK